MRWYATYKLSPIYFRHEVIITGVLIRILFFPCLQGGQEHFYLETQGSLAIPGEEDEMTIISSTQNPGKTQALVAAVLKIPANRVVCKLKRMGGGFGGKVRS